MPEPHLARVPRAALPEPLVAELAAEALALLARPDLAPRFGPGTLAEVGVAADLPGLGPFHGIVDRLIVTDGQLHAIDYKTNRVLPARAEDIPAGILAQMGAYALGLRAVWPGHALRLSVLWTRDGSLMDVPEALALRAVAAAAPS